MPIEILEMIFQWLLIFSEFRLFSNWLQEPDIVYLACTGSLLSLYSQFSIISYLRKKVVWIG